jgi:hypothetical protein
MGPGQENVGNQEACEDQADTQTALKPGDPARRLLTRIVHDTTVATGGWPVDSVVAVCDRCTVAT